MPEKKPINPAQVVDQFMQRTVIGVALLATKHAGNAVQYLVSDRVSHWIGWGNNAISLMIVLLLFPAFFRYFRLRRTNPSVCIKSDGFLSQMFKEAAARAFAITFVTLLVMVLVTQKALQDLPAAFFLNIAVAVCIGSLAAAYFFLTRDTDDEDDDALEG